MKKRARAQLELEADIREHVRAGDADPEGHVDARAWVSRAIDCIDSDEFDLLVRRYVFEETGRELADNLGQSSASLRMRLMRLRSTLSERSLRRRIIRRREPPAREPA